MSDDFPTLRAYMRARQEPDRITPEEQQPTELEEVAKQLRLANLIQWAGITNNHKGYAAEIEEGLRT